MPAARLPATALAALLPAAAIAALPAAALAAAALPADALRRSPPPSASESRPELRLDLQPCVLRLQPYAMEAAAIYVMIARAARASTCAAPWSPSARAAAS